MGFPDEEARGALRLSLGRTTTDAEVERAAEIIPATIARLRDAASSASDPLAAPAQWARADNPTEEVPA
jgi:cysteine desulfurase